MILEKTAIEDRAAAQGLQLRRDHSGHRWLLVDARRGWLVAGPLLDMRAVADCLAEREQITLAAMDTAMRSL